MAERRMFAKTVIGSDAFLDMPTSARLLYYDLGMRADDDGFVNSPKSIMRMIGASDDDMRLLIGKKFIIPFETGLVVIKHWNINNYIQKDRYVETKYKDEKSLLEFDENKSYRLPQTVENSTCIQNVYTTDTQDRLGKDRLGKSKDSILVPYETICERFNQICVSLSRIEKITDKRKSKIKARWNELKTVEAFENLFYLTEQSDFLCGRDKDWKCSFDWLMMNDTNYIKVLEGNYANKKPKDDLYEKIMKEALQDEFTRNNPAYQDDRYQLPNPGEE